MEEKKTLEKMNESNVQVDAPASEQPSVGTFEEHPISTLEEPVELDKPNQNSVHPQGVPSAMPNQGIMTLEERIEQAVLAAGTDINILDLPTLQAADKVMVVSGNSIGYMAMDKLASVVGGKMSTDLFCLTGGVYEDVDLGLPSGTKWAKYNIGASKETEYGDLFGWGCTSPYRLNGTTSLDNTGNYTTSYANKIQTDLKGTTDAATVNWGRGWKMPTKAQFDELIANCTSEWTQIGGVNGRKFTSKKNNSYIFFPAAGYVNGASLGARGSNGNYWSSSFDSSASAWVLGFHSSGQNVGALYRYYGCSVRAVRA